MSFVIDKTVTDKAPKKTVVSQFTGNNSNSRQRALFIPKCTLLYYVTQSGVKGKACIRSGCTE